jgi:serine phosphatase RsbU (regulator of sigma subunit)
MVRVTSEVQRRVERIGRLPLRRLVVSPNGAGEGERLELIDSLVSELGETAPLVESFQFVPMPPTVRVLGPEEKLPGEPPAPEALPLRAVRIQMKEVLAELERLKATDRDREFEASSVQVGEHLAAAVEMAEKVAERALDAAMVTREVEAAQEELRRNREEHADPEESGDRKPISPGSTPGDSLQGAVLEIHEGGTSPIHFGEEVLVPVSEEGEIVGQVRAQVKGEELLHRVLTRTRRSQGEVPFAVDQEGELFTIDEADREILEEVPLDSDRSDERPLSNWVVVTTAVPEAGVRFGIARPIRESLTEIRRTAIRNFGFGTGLIVLALLGVVPITRKMSRNLQQVTEAAERIARGDLKTRVPVRSRNEIGQLAHAFNRMAHDLEDHQQRLVDEEARRREEDVEKRLLQAEFDRKSEELEEARRFQLSLLPKELPKDDAFELAVAMTTATEVGGDYYDFRLGKGGAVTAAIGDATGHGAKAGTMVTVIKSLFSAYPPEASLAGFLTEAGAAIKRMDLGRMAMALTLVRLQDRTVTVSAAGMPPVLLFRPSRGEVEEIALEGMPLGGLSYDYREQTVEVEPGDTLLLMSDGLPELPNSEEEPLGYERASELFGELATAPLDEIISRLGQAAMDWVGGEAPSDDITLVVLRVT